jgi:hypothetical protein
MVWVAVIEEFFVRFWWAIKSKTNNKYGRWLMFRRQKLLFSNSCYFIIINWIVKSCSLFMFFDLMILRKKIPAGHPWCNDSLGVSFSVGARARVRQQFPRLPATISQIGKKSNWRHSIIGWNLAFRAWLAQFWQFLIHSLYTVIKSNW